jgi:hypothetical protein
MSLTDFSCNIDVYKNGTLLTSFNYPTIYAVILVFARFIYPGSPYKIIVSKNSETYEFDSSKLV